MNHKRQIIGCISEHKFVLWCLEQGHHVCKSVIDNQADWDFLVMFVGGDNWKRVQVKTAAESTPDGITYVQFHNGTNHKTGKFIPYEENSYDFMAIVYKDQIFLFPAADLRGRDHPRWCPDGYVNKAPKSARIDWEQYMVQGELVE